ncbi:hypothetical protein D915_010767, partial [Fasciola hepatica]
DQAGNKREVTQPISVDGVPSRQFSHLSQWLLRSRHAVNLCVVFYASWVFVFLFLLIPLSFSKECLLNHGVKSSFCHGMHRFARNPALSGPVFVFLLYELVGPIIMGFLIPGYFGAVFSFGIIIGGTQTWEALTYFYELVQVSQTIFPLKRIQQKALLDSPCIFFALYSE